MRVRPLHLLVPPGISLSLSLFCLCQVPEPARPVPSPQQVAGATWALAGVCQGTEGPPQPGKGGHPHLAEEGVLVRAYSLLGELPLYFHFLILLASLVVQSLLPSLAVLEALEALASLVVHVWPPWEEDFSWKTKMKIKKIK